MKSLTEYLTYNEKTRRAFVNITPDIRKLVLKSKVQEGLCLVNAMHITASVFINDNESGLHQDYEKWLEAPAPNKPIGEYEKNKTIAHIPFVFLFRGASGREVVVAITNGK